MPARERHKFKWMIYKGHKVAIDRDIAPLLDKMWKLGIGTINSCQAQCSMACKHKYKITKSTRGECWHIIPTKNCRNSVWLVFESCKDLENFYNIIAEYTPIQAGDDSMYAKMSCGRFVDTGKGSRKYRSKDGWCFNFFMENYGMYGHWGRPKYKGKRLPYHVWIEDGCDKNDFVIQPQITFPRAHMEYVESKLDQAIKRKRK